MNTTAKASKSRISVPMAEEYNSAYHSDKQIDAMIEITRTQHIPLVFGQGGQSPGQIIDEMLSDGGVTKISLDLDKSHW